MSGKSAWLDVMDADVSSDELVFESYGSIFRIYFVTLSISQTILYTREKKRLHYRYVVRTIDTKIHSDDDGEGADDYALSNLYRYYDPVILLST